MWGTLAHAVVEPVFAAQVHDVIMPLLEEKTHVSAIGGGELVVVRLCEACSLFSFSHTHTHTLTHTHTHSHTLTHTHTHSHSHTLLPSPGVGPRDGEQTRTACAASR